MNEGKTSMQMVREFIEFKSRMQPIYDALAEIQRREMQQSVNKAG